MKKVLVVLMAALLLCSAAVSVLAAAPSKNGSSPTYGTPVTDESSAPVAPSVPAYVPTASVVKNNSPEVKAFMAEIASILGGDEADLGTAVAAGKSAGKDTVIPAGLDAVIAEKNLSKYTLCEIVEIDIDGKDELKMDLTTITPFKADDTVICQIGCFTGADGAASFESDEIKWFDADAKVNADGSVRITIGADALECDKTATSTVAALFIQNK